MTIRLGDPESFLADQGRIVALGAGTLLIAGLVFLNIKISGLMFLACYFAGLCWLIGIAVLLIGRSVRWMLTHWDIRCTP